jgi:hypothetical protein
MQILYLWDSLDWKLNLEYALMTEAESFSEKLAHAKQIQGDILVHQRIIFQTLTAVGT